MSARAGYSLVEAVVALTAGAFVCAGMAVLFQAEERLVRSRETRSTRVEALRVSASVLHAELEAIVPEEDLAAVGADSVALRQFRGLAVTCTPADRGVVTVRYEGQRLPDETKDSVLPLPEGPALPLGWSAAATTSCPGTGTLLRWSVSAALPVGTPLLLFERGTYALSSRALRLRRGREGRQPITAELLSDRGSAFALVRAGGPGARPLALAATLSLAGVPTAYRLRIPFLNAADTLPRP